MTLAVPLIVIVASTVGCMGPNGSSIDRPADPVVVTGADVGALAGTPAARVVAFRAKEGVWTQIPVQVDEMVATTMDKVYGLPATQVFYSSHINVPVTVYADANTFVGADPDPALDADDEVAFMARDAGASAAGVAAPAGTVGGGVEVRIDDPLDKDAVGYVYLFAGDGTLAPGAGKAYVGYQFNLGSGDYKTTYKRTDGPNPENSTVTGSTYTAHFTDRWLLDSLTLTKGSKPGVDLIDRFKYDIRAFCFRNEDTFDDEEGAFVVNRTGPVRALRSAVGTNSGPNTQNTYAFYDQAIYAQVDLRVHSIPNVGAHIDFNREMFGMTYRNPQVPGGVTVDGRPDVVPDAVPTWWTFAGAQGGLALSTTSDSDAVAPPRTAYEDNTEGSADARCTGDTEAVADSGVNYGDLACTDPGSGCPGHLRDKLRIVATPADYSPLHLQAIAEQGRTPLKVTVTAR